MHLQILIVFITGSPYSSSTPLALLLHPLGLYFSDDNTDNILENWSQQDRVVINDFEFLEPVLSQRCVVLQLLSENRPRKLDLQQGLVKQLTRLTKAASQAGRHQVGWEKHSGTFN